MSGIFEVDRNGLRKLLERRGKEFALYELFQNAFDEEGVTRVIATLLKEPGSRVATIRVEDDSANGFADLTHAYTLFAESVKKANPRQRGRFNIGEKLVIAACEESRIVTTKGGVEFVGNDRRTLRRTTNRGSVFEGTIRMTNGEFQACCEAMRLLLPPSGIETTFNGELIQAREPIATVATSLPTEIADAEGYLRRTTRVTDINIYETRPDEVGMLYEMGIPVVETGDDWHVDVQQKVPLNSDRDNVPPSFLRAVRTAVLNEVHAKLDMESANHVWVKQAMENPDISEEAVRSVIKNRFGDKVVSYDLNDPEANNRAVANGFTVVHGRQLGKDEWANVRKAVGAVPSAGSMFPTDAGRVVPVEPVEPTEQEAKMLAGIKRLARVLIGADIQVVVISNPRDNAAARYGHRHMMVNRPKVGRQWFEALDERSISLIIHELGHEYESNHLSESYYRALTRLGARLAIASAHDPSLLVL